MVYNIMNFLNLITRVKNEPFIEEFVRHYFNEGVDIIHIFDDNSTIPFPEYLINNPKVVIHKSYIRHKLHCFDPIGPN